MAEKKAWRKWFPQDWRADAPLRMCSYAARGLWADVLTLMHESNVVGFLLVEGVAPTPKQLVGLLGGSEKEIKKLLDELGGNNVYSVTGKPMPDDVHALIPEDMAAGVLLSRRMVRDEAKAAKDRENGKGGGNPNLKGGHKPKSNPGVNPSPNPQSQRSEARGQIEEPQAAASLSPGAARDIDDLKPPAFLDRSVDQAFALWLPVAQDLRVPEVGFLNSDRRAEMHARLHEIGGLEGWKVALTKVREAQFLVDEDGQPQRWLNLGWLLKPENFTGLMEGRYAERRRNDQPGTADKFAALAQFGRAGSG